MTKPILLFGEAPECKSGFIFKNKNFLTFFIITQPFLVFKRLIVEKQKTCKIEALKSETKQMPKGNRNEKIRR